MSDPDKYDHIPDERTEEEELMEQIDLSESTIVHCEEQIYCIRILLNKELHKKQDLMNTLRAVRAENAAFLKEYCPDGIGSDPCDDIGSYKNKEDAVKSRKEAEEKYFGEFAPYQPKKEK